MPLESVSFIAHSYHADYKFAAQLKKKLNLIFVVKTLSEQ
jgi:hypothetical protein